MLPWKYLESVAVSEKQRGNNLIFPNIGSFFFVIKMLLDPDLIFIMAHYELRVQRSRYFPQLFSPSNIAQWGGSSYTDIVLQGPYCEEGTIKQRCREALLYCMCLSWFDRLMEWVYNGPVWALRLRWSLGLEWVSPTGGSGVLLRWDKPTTTSFCATAFKLTIPDRMAWSSKDIYLGFHIILGCIFQSLSYTLQDWWI